MPQDVSGIIQFVKEQAASDAYGAFCRNQLTELLEIDTCVGANPERKRDNESATFALIETVVRQMCGDRAVVQRLTVADETEAGANEGRCNLVVRVPGRGEGRASGPIVAHTRIDTQGSWFAPRTDADHVYGCGATDAKGSIATLLGQIRLLEAVREEFDVTYPRDRVYPFVIDGTQSWCESERGSGCDAIVYGPTDNVPYRAGRGVLEFGGRLATAGRGRVSTLEMMSFVAAELEEASRKLAHEHAHALFDAADVRLTLQRLRPQGADVAADAGKVVLLITLRTSVNPKRVLMHLTELIDGCLDEYAERFGTTNRRPNGGARSIGAAREYTLSLEPQAKRIGFRLEISGAAASSESIAPNDNALAKAAYVLMALLRAARNYPNLDGRVELVGTPDGPLVLEGRQTFVPPQTLEQVEQRIADALRHGVRAYCGYRTVRFDEAMVQSLGGMRRESAFETAEDADVVQAFRASFAALERAWPNPTGWLGGCGAHRFAEQGVPMVVFGPGRAGMAGAGDEHIAVRDIQDAVALGTLSTLRLSGALGTP